MGQAAAADHQAKKKDVANQVAAAASAHPDEIAQAKAAVDGAHAEKKDAATAAADAHPEAVEAANAAAAELQAKYEQAAAAFVAAYPDQAAAISAAVARGKGTCRGSYGINCTNK